MKIAFLVPYPVWPPDSGTRIRNMQMLRYLAKHCQIHLLVVSSQQIVEPEGLQLAGTQRFDPGPASIGDTFARHLRMRPTTHRSTLRAQINATLAQLQPQALIAVGTASAQFIDFNAKVPGMRYFFDEAGTDHLRTGRLRELETTPWTRLKLTWDEWRLQRYERYFCQRADFLLTVVPGEAEYLRRTQQTPVGLVPCGANLDMFDFHYAGDDNTTMLFCGDITYGPNEDALAYFLTCIFPHIVERHPKARFIAVGRYRGERLPRLAARFPQVELTGYVEEMNPQWRRASIFVNPMRQGRGFITKIMDAFTAGLAVVSTNFLMDELGIEEGLHFLGADNERQFAQKVCQLLEEPEHKRAQIYRARAFAEVHDWEAAFSALGEALGLEEKL